MQGNQGPISTARTANTHVASLRERSSADLIQAIRSPGDDGYTVNRARICLRHYYDPDMDAHDRAEMLDSYAKALRAYPKWAVAQAFDAWERTGTRRPSPGEIAILADRAVKEITDELTRRSPPVAQLEPPRPIPSKEAAAEIMARAGFTPAKIEAVRKSPMASSIAQAVERANAPPAPHWTERASQSDLDDLRKAREANAIIQASREDAAKERGEDEW